MKKKYNIAILLDPVNQQVGGSFYSTLRFADLLKKRGNKIIFIAAKYPGRPNIDYCNNMKIYRFKSILLPKTEKQFYISFPTKKQIEKLIIDEKIDILHIMIPTPAAISSIRAAKKLNIPIIAHSHTQPENIFLHLPKKIQSEKINNLCYKYLIWIYKNAKITICPSKFSEKLLKKHNKKLKTVVVSNGVDLKKFKKISIKNFIKKYGISKKDIRILFVGRLHPEKNVETLIKAMQRIVKENKNVKLDIVGAGHLREKLENLTKKLQFEENVKFYGKISNKELIEAYNICDIFCLPSIAELEGMVVLEAMACGKPLVIANSKNSASPFFVKNNGMLFKTKDSKDLAKKLLILIKDDKLRKKMAKESLKKAESYDINNSVDKLEEIYTQVKNGRKIL